MVAMHVDLISILFWIVLLVIGVSDAQRHRIPNQLVALLLIVTCTYLSSKSSTEWGEHLLGGLIAFSVSLLFYLKKAMAAGDVKLLFVIGMWVGASQLASVSAAIILAGGIISCFYLALYLVTSGLSWQQNVRSYYYYRATYKFSHRTKLVIPFAPAVVVGLASYYYLI